MLLGALKHSPKHSCSLPGQLFEGTCSPFGQGAPGAQPCIPPALPCSMNPCIPPALPYSMIPANPQCLVPRMQCREPGTCLLRKPGILPLQPSVMASLNTWKGSQTLRMLLNNSSTNQIPLTRGGISFEVHGRHIPAHLHSWKSRFWMLDQPLDPASNPSGSRHLGCEWEQHPPCPAHRGLKSD